MAKTNTRKYLIYGSIAAIVGVIGYYIWKSSKKDEKPKDETPAPDNDGKEKDGKVNENKGKGDGGGATVTPPTQAQIDLATAYRKWANSTDWKIKTYGATSKYKLDETSRIPYNDNFTDSYSVGKTDYDAFLKALDEPVKPPVKSKPKVYAVWGAFIYNTLSDIVPYRTATSQNEYVGESLGIVKHHGVEYYKLAWDRGEVKYIARLYVSKVVN